MNAHRLHQTVAASFLSALLLAGIGCGTTSPQTAAPRPGSGLAEYLELVSHSREAVQTAMNSLATLNGQGAAPSKRVVSAFSEEVDRLESASLRVRARSQAMQARGDAYFENWRENIAAIEDPRIRASAEQHRSELQQSFSSIKVTLQQTRQSFQSFLGGLRTLRRALESDPAQITAGPTRDLALETREHGLKVEQGLDGVAAELRKMSAMLSPTTVATQE